MTCSGFNESRENKFLSCPLALLEPAPAAVESTEVTSCRLWRVGAAGTRAEPHPAPEPRVTREAPNRPLADPQG